MLQFIDHNINHFSYQKLHIILIMPNKYLNLQFKIHWEISENVSYMLGQCESIISAISELPIRPEVYTKLLGVALIKGAQATTAIEGNTLTDEEIEQIYKGGSLPPSKDYQQKEVQNILDAMNVLLKEVTVESHTKPITPNLLLRFHEMIGVGLDEHFDAIPGRFRTDSRIVGPYRCPDPKDVKELVNKLCDWLSREFGFTSDRQSFRDAVIEAIVAHVYLEWIHPFGDGNGRTGRLLELYILLRAGNPDISSHILSNFYNLTRPEYYRQLKAAGESKDLSEFIAYAVKGFRDGLKEKLKNIQENVFLVSWRSFIYDEFAEEKYRKTVFKRRRNLMLDMPINQRIGINEITEISPSVARSYANFKRQTLLRDIKALDSMGLLLVHKDSIEANTYRLRNQMPKRRLSQ